MTSLQGRRIGCISSAGVSRQLEAEKPTARAAYDKKSLTPGYQDSFGDKVTTPIGMRPNTIDPQLIKPRSARRPRTDLPRDRNVSLPVRQADRRHGLSTCGICVLVATDLVISGGSIASFADYYAATSGAVTLTNVDINHTGTDGFAHLTGSLSVTLRHVGRDSQNGPTDTIVDNCSTFVTGNFDAKLTAGT